MASEKTSSMASASDATSSNKPKSLEAIASEAKSPKGTSLKATSSEASVSNKDKRPCEISESDAILIMTCFLPDEQSIPIYSHIGCKLMAKMGYTGGCLGKREGIIMPLEFEPSQRLPRAGLGYDPTKTSFNGSGQKFIKFIKASSETGTPTISSMAISSKKDALEATIASDNTGVALTKSDASVQHLSDLSPASSTVPMEPSSSPTKKLSYKSDSSYED